VQGYLVDLARSTRNHPDVALGASPRGVLTWQRVAQARAWLSGRGFVAPDDIQAVAEPVLAVRLGLDRGDAAALVTGLIRQVEVPVQP
jgi:MoxR-like ATPase